MEGGSGGFVTNNVPSCAVTTTGLNESEQVYDCGLQQSDKVLHATINAQDVNVAAAVPINGNEESTISGVNEPVNGCSSSAVTSMEAKRSDNTVAGALKCDSIIEQRSISKYRVPVMGSPPADLMVVNTNGFNPLQHAALRGNPG